MGRVFDNLLDSVANSVRSDHVRPTFLVEDDSSAVPRSSGNASSALSEAPARRRQATPIPPIPQPQEDYLPSVAEVYGVAHPLAVFIVPSYRNEPPSNAMLGELGLMQELAIMRNDDGTPSFELARWIPNGPGDLEGRLIAIDPLAQTRNNRDLGEGSNQRELNIRTDIDRVVLVVVRFPISEAQFAQIHTVFCTYGKPRMVADFSNAGLYMDMQYGSSRRERENYGTNALQRPYSVKVLSQFDVVRVPTQRLADQIEREMEGAS